MLRVVYSWSLYCINWPIILWLRVLFSTLCTRLVMDGLSTLLVGKMCPIVLRMRGMYVYVTNTGWFFSLQKPFLWLNTCPGVDLHSCVCLSVFSSVFSPDRTENADGQEFLPGTDDKKTTRFTDVSSHAGPVCFHAFEVCNIFPVSVDYSLRAKPHLACLSSTWATPLWAVGSWDWRTPWPIQGLSCFCKFLIFLDSIVKNKSACEDF